MYNGSTLAASGLASTGFATGHYIIAGAALIFGGLALYRVYAVGRKRRNKES